MAGVGGGGVVSVPDCRGSGEITALTDSQGKAERPNKQGRKESKQVSDLRKHLARCGHAMLLFSPRSTLFRFKQSYSNPFAHRHMRRCQEALAPLPLELC